VRGRKGFRTSLPSPRRSLRQLFFFIWTAKNGLIASPVSRFRSDLGFHPFGEPMSSSALLGRARGVRRKQKCEKHRGKFPCAWWPQLVGEKGRSSSSSHRLPRAVKACRRRTRSFHAARVELMRGSIYRGPIASGRIHLLPSLLSPKPPRAMAGYGDGAANNDFGRRSLHQWEGRLLYMAGYPAPPDFCAPGGWRLSTGASRSRRRQWATPSTPRSMR
jgi:hypothetical protein